MTIQGTAMEWWIIGTLIFVYLVLLACMYLMSARESRALTNYALLILLGEDTHATQRASLIELIRATDAEDASKLGRKARTAITKVAMRLSDTVLRMNQLAWNLKTDPPVARSSATASPSEPVARIAARAGQQ